MIKLNLEKVEAIKESRKRKLVPSVEKEEELLQSARKRSRDDDEEVEIDEDLEGGTWTIPTEYVYQNKAILFCR